jgi:hypothetical protein
LTLLGTAINSIRLGQALGILEVRSSWVSY